MPKNGIYVLISQKYFTMSLLQTPKEEHHANMDKLYSSQEFGYSDVKYE